MVSLANAVCWSVGDLPVESIVDLKAGGRAERDGAEDQGGDEHRHATGQQGWAAHD